MNKMILMAVAMMATSAAQASTLNCSTSPTANGGQYEISIQTQSGSNEGTANVTFHGGMAHFIAELGTFSVALSHEGPEMAVFSNSENDFELSVVYQRMGGGTGFVGNVTLEGMGGARINETVHCN